MKLSKRRSLVAASLMLAMLVHGCGRAVNEKNYRDVERETTIPSPVIADMSR
ncbi:MAG: hypothetical protein M3Q07_04960 [Pseudobdellovibrionaceae bacterium]|nr:hypothetical protein [Pseudobdellovibrionaceae bacterium]